MTSNHLMCFQPAKNFNYDHYFNNNANFKLTKTLNLKKISSELTKHRLDEKGDF